MRGVQVLVFVLVAAVLAGCGGKVDTAKVTYTRTTVPAADANSGNGGGGGKPKTNDPAFTMEKLRELDPCGLLTKDILSAVGKPADNQPDDFGSCSNFMKDKGGEDLSISIYVGESADGAEDADLNIGGLPGFESELTDGDACFVTAVTSTSPNFGIKVQAGGKGDDLCGSARTVLTSAVNLIRDDPPNRDDESGSIAAVDPCALVDEAAMNTALGVEAPPSPYTLHWCNWIGGGVNLGVWLLTGYDPKTSTSPGQPVNLDGLTVYQTATTAGGTSCKIEWMHRATNDESQAEVVQLTLDKSAPATGDSCTSAQAAAKLVIAALPKP